MTNPNGTAYRHYVPIGNSEVVYNRWTSGTNSIYYLIMDHLGSTASVMDSNGNAVVKENFAAGGARRGDNWTGKPTTAERRGLAANPRGRLFCLCLLRLGPWRGRHARAVVAEGARARLYVRRARRGGGRQLDSQVRVRLCRIRSQLHLH
jgi:hypothetical protein